MGRVRVMPRQGILPWFSDRPWFVYDDWNHGPLPGEFPAVALVPDPSIPSGEAWVCERRTPLQRAAGFRPRWLGKIVDIGE